MTIDGDDAGKDRPGRQQEEADRGADLDRRRRELDAAIAARRPRQAGEEGSTTGGLSGMGQALRLASEFVAAIIVGAALGWVVDLGLGTSPWGLIVSLLLGFCAGVLNVLRAAGRVAEFGSKKTRG